jgi:transcriptional regulator GlxA family with amidase domain
MLAGEGVTEAALAFGFAHFGRFAQAYAARFGEKPSQTVKRARH